MAGLDLGTLTVKLAADVDQLKRDLAKATEETRKTNESLKSLGEMAFGAFEGIGGAAEKASSVLKKMQKGVEDIFGENANAAGQKWGKQIQDSLGLTKGQLEGLGQSVKGLSGAFEVVGAATTALKGPVGAAMLMVFGLVAAWGALKEAINSKGWLPSFVYEPWFKAFTDATTPKTDRPGDPGGIDFNRPAPGPKDEAGKQKFYGKTFDPVTGTYKSMEPAYVPPEAPQKSWTDSAKETITDGIKTLADKFKEGAADFEGLFDLFTGKGKTKAERSKDESYEKQRQAALSRDVKEMYEEEAKIREGMFVAMSEGVDKINDQTRKQTEGLQASSRELWDYIAKADQDRLERERERQESLRKIDEQIKQETAARWAAVSGGQFGTAFKIGGTAGAAMNIVGGAFAGAGQNTSAVLQGAAQGGQAGGPWGALIGAIVALATKTESFKKILDTVEGVLGDILPLLDQMLRQVLLSLEPPLKMLSVVLNLFGKLGEMLNGVLKPLEAMNDAMMSLFDAIGGLVDMIGSVNLGMEGGTGGGKANYKGDNEFGMSWLTGEAEFKYLAGWIKDETKNVGKGPDVSTWNWEKNIGTEQLGQWAGSKIKVAAGDDRDMYGVHQPGSAGYKEVYGFNSQKDFDAALARYKESMADAIELPAAIGQMSQAANQAQRALHLMNDPLYKVIEEQTALSQGMLRFNQTVRDAALQMKVLQEGLETGAGYDAYAAQRDLQAENERITSIYEERYNAEHGLTTSAENAARSLNRFNDALVNGVQGYKIGLTMFNAAMGMGQGAYQSGGASGYGSGASAGGAGGGLGGTSAGASMATTLNVTIQGAADPQGLWDKLQALMRRDNFIQGSTPFARAPARLGAY